MKITNFLQYFHLLSSLQQFNLDHTMNYLSSIYFLALSVDIIFRVCLYKKIKLNLDSTGEAKNTENLDFENVIIFGLSGRCVAFSGGEQLLRDRIK